jgi:hypothetical protein
VAKPAKRMTVFSFAIETSALASLLAEHAVRMDIGVVGGESHVAASSSATAIPSQRCWRRPSRKSDSNNSFCDS